MIDSWGISYEIAQRQISVEPTDDRSTLVQVIACCHQQQAVIRANVNTDLCHHMASLGHNVLKLKIILEDHFIILCINHWLSWYTDYKQPLSHATECGRFWSQIMDCGRKKILDALQYAGKEVTPGPAGGCHSDSLRGRGRQWWLTCRRNDTCPWWSSTRKFNTLRPIQNGRHFPDNVFKYISLSESITV